MEYENEQRGYDGQSILFDAIPSVASIDRANIRRVDEPRGYDRERSRSPRADRRGDDDARARSASPSDRDRMDSRYVGFNAIFQTYTR